METENSPKAGETKVVIKEEVPPNVQKPLGLEQEGKIQQPVPIQEGEIIYRHFDSDDIVRIRTGTIITDIESIKGNQQQGKDLELKERFSIDMGQLQKITVCLAIKKCPWFSDDINEEDGVTEEIYQRRMSIEFRKIPIKESDRAFKEGQKFNKVEFNAGDLKKK